MDIKDLARSSAGPRPGDHPRPPSTTHQAQPQTQSQRHQPEYTTSLYDPSLMTESSSHQHDRTQGPIIDAPPSTSARNPRKRKAPAEPQPDPSLDPTLASTSSNDPSAPLPTSASATTTTTTNPRPTKKPIRGKLRTRGAPARPSSSQRIPSSSSSFPNQSNDHNLDSVGVAGEGDNDRDLDTDGEPDTEAKKQKRRNRVHFSCVECHRRKQKCDRLQPCTPCLIRKVPHMCRPFINGFEDPIVYEGDLKMRLGRIEGILERLVPILDGIGVGGGGGGGGGGFRAGDEGRSGRMGLVAMRHKEESDRSESTPGRERDLEGEEPLQPIGMDVDNDHDGHGHGQGGGHHSSSSRRNDAREDFERLLVVDTTDPGSLGEFDIGSLASGNGNGVSRAPDSERNDPSRSSNNNQTANHSSTQQPNSNPNPVTVPLPTQIHNYSPPQEMDNGSSPSGSNVVNMRSSTSTSSFVGMGMGMGKGMGQQQQPRQHGQQQQQTQQQVAQTPLQPTLQHRQSYNQPVTSYANKASSTTSAGTSGGTNNGNTGTYLATSGRPQIQLDNPSQELRGILETLAESGITRRMLVGLLESVPEKGLSDSLVELYFREIDWTRYKLHRPAFSQQYMQFFDLLAADPQNPALDKGLIKWLPLYFAVLAIATLSATADMVGGEAGQKAWSRRFHGSSRIALSSAKALQRDNLDVIYAGLLTARYMLLVRRAAEGSTPLTSAYQLGLYRDGSVLNLSDKKEIELRRRAWAMVYHLDRTTALLVGRPTSISDAHSDTREPANLDDAELETDFDPRGHSLMTPTEWTQLILRHRLAQIIGRISDHTFAIKPPDYSAVLKLDRELLAWQSNLPSFFATHHANTSLDRKYHFIFVQRHLLACEFLFARITLHRPYLLRKRDQNDQYAYSREAAIESAKADLIGRRSFIFEKPLDLKVNSGGYRVLNSYIVLGVAIKLDPTSPRAEELRRLLEVVAGTAPDELGRYSEPMVKDEMAIVDFLTQRARTNADGNAVRSSAPIPPYSHILPSHRNAPSMLSRKSESNSRGTDDMYRPTVSESGRQAEDPAWSFVAPQLPSLDVHQPFGDGSSRLHQSTDRQYPPPLAAPAPRQRNPHNIPPWEQAGWSNPYATPMVESMRPLPSPRPNSQRALSNSSQHLAPLSDTSNSNANVDASLSFSGQDPLAGPSGPSTAMAGAPSEPMTSADWADWDNWWNSNQATLGTPMPANSSTTGQMGFNPFALSQFGQTGAGDVVEESSETAFLNLLLSTIANTNAPN